MWVEGRNQYAGGLSDIVQRFFLTVPVGMLKIIIGGIFQCSECFVLNTPSPAPTSGKIVNCFTGDF